MWAAASARPRKPRGGGSVFDDEQTAFVRLKRVGSADAAMARLRDAGLRHYQD